MNAGCARHIARNTMNDDYDPYYDDFQETYCDACGGVAGTSDCRCVDDDEPVDLDLVARALT